MTRSPKMVPLFEDDESQTAPDFTKFPVTRYQGSKRKMLQFLFANIPSPSHSGKVLDLFSGSGTVSLLLRSMGYHVHGNDFQMYSAGVTELFLTCDADFINTPKHENSIKNLVLSAPENKDNLVEDNYSGIYFTDEENRQIDNFMHNAENLTHEEQLLYRYCVGEALIKKRPFNLFHRANLSQRLAKVERSFGNKATWDRSIVESAIITLNDLRKCSFEYPSTGHKATSLSANDLSQFSDEYDIVYIDPPYCNNTGKSIDYSDFYNFLEGLWDYSLFGKGIEKYKHKPLVRRPSAWAHHETAKQWLRDAVKHFSKATIALSYRDDGLPSVETLESILSEGGRSVKTLYNGGYQYKLSKNKTSQEILVLSIPLPKCYIMLS